MAYSKCLSDTYGKLRAITGGMVLMSIARKQKGRETISTTRVEQQGYKD